MKRFKQIKDILEAAQRFHSELGRRYKELESNAANERVLMFLDYVSEHELQLAKVIALFEEDLPGSTLETWSDFSEEFALPDPAQAQPDLEGLSIDELLLRYLDYNDVLIATYQELSARTGVQELRELFEGLIELEHHSEMAAVKDVMRFNEL